MGLAVLVRRVGGEGAGCLWTGANGTFRALEYMAIREVWYIEERMLFFWVWKDPIITRRYIFRSGSRIEIRKLDGTGLNATSFLDWEERHWENRVFQNWRESRGNKIRPILSS